MPVARRDMLRRHALSHGLLAALVAWTSELARPPELQMALRNITANWTMPPRTWKEAANQFAIVFGDRFTLSAN